MLEACLAKDQGQPLANSRQDTEAISLTTCRKVDHADIQGADPFPTEPSEEIQAPADTLTVASGEMLKPRLQLSHTQIPDHMNHGVINVCCLSPCVRDNLLHSRRE